VVLTRPGATKASESVDTAGVDRKTNCVTKNFQERSGTKAFISEHQERRQNKNEDKFFGSLQRKTNIFVPQLLKKRRKTNLLVTKLSKEQRQTKVFVPKPLKERRQTKVFVPQPSKERRKTNSFIPQLSKECRKSNVFVHQLLMI
jgi:hypothetical protein